MKKSIFVLGLMSITTIVSAQSHSMYVGADAKLRVNDGALFFNGGGWKNEAKVATSTRGAEVESMGDIMVDAVDVPSSTINIASDSRFKLLADDTSYKTYGQLYVKGVKQSNIAGKVEKEYRSVSHAGTSNKGFQQVALPFYGYTFTNLNDDLGGYLDVSGNRWAYGSFYVWDNKKARYNKITNSNVGRPYDAFILPLVDNTQTVKWDPTLKRSFNGVPVSDEENNTKVTLEVAEVDFRNGDGRNYFGEVYKSYIFDPFVSGGWSNADYGKNITHFGNPFLVNIDLSNITSVDRITGDTDGIKVNDIDAVAYYNTVEWNPTTGGSSNNMEVMKVVGGVFQVGHLEKLIFKPMTKVFMKFSKAQAPNNYQTINLNNTRYFGDSGRTSSDYSVFKKGANLLSINQTDIVKQLEVILYNDKDEELGRTYYAVSPFSKTGFTNQLSLQSSIPGKTIYTKEELVEGGEDVSQSYELYINEANEEDFKGKEIPLYIDNANARKVKFNLYEGGELVSNNGILSNSKTFYFSKNDKDQVYSIKSGDVLDITKGKYELYYDEPVFNEILNKEIAVREQTIVARRNGDWTIFFGLDIDSKSVKVEVFNVVGQLVHLKENVESSVEYVLPLNENLKGIYLVKIQDEKGNIITRKIVK